MKNRQKNRLPGVLFNKLPMQIKEFLNRVTLVTSGGHISSSKMSIYEWSSLQ